MSRWPYPETHTEDFEKDPSVRCKKSPKYLPLLCSYISDLQPEDRFKEAISVDFVL